MSNLSRPLVSIVTTSYNQAPYLEETIRSVLNQDYPNLEYIIIDGGSTDGSVEIIRKYQNRMAYWVSEPDRGQTHALIKGFQFAHGEILGWLCSDDVLEPSMVSISVGFHQKYPQAVLTYGDRIWIDAKGNIYSAQRFPNFRSWFISWGFSIPQETTMFSRQAFDAAGGFDETYQSWMDFDLWCRLISQGDIIHIPAYLGHFRSHPANKSTLFSQQFQSSGFSTGQPATYAAMFRKYFGTAPNKLKIKIEALIRNPLAMLDRRSRRYREDLALVHTFRQS
jgi:glycosyltransferase involved in cell wall biosynthesis